MKPAQDYTQHWDEKFRTRDWGRWPPEDLVRFMGRNFKQAKKADVQVLEVGCGPGANLWFLQNEGFAVAGIDASSKAIELAAARLSAENQGMGSRADLRVGNFSKLPWKDGSFDVALDIFALYANTVPVIQSALAEIARVLKPGGLFYSKLWGTNTTGYGTGKSLETATFDEVPDGPCRDMGVSHFFSRAEIDKLFGRHFAPLAIETVTRNSDSQRIEEFHCSFKKA